MSNQPINIPKHPTLKPSEDYYRLRREGIGFIEQMGSRQWTDYNQHDPGITILEALCFAITDLAYRTGWDIQDLLTPAKGPVDPASPLPDQAFFTARNILTNNACTPDDFRRLLIDLESVRNAWIYCKQCACDLPYFAWCKDNKINIGTAPPTDPLLHSRLIKPLGLYDVLLELESDPVLGDLNDRKIEDRFFVFDEKGQPHLVTIELRFPEWRLEKDKVWQRFLKEGGFEPSLKKFNRSDDPNERAPLTDAKLRQNWQSLFYAGFEINFNSGTTAAIDNVTLRLFGSTTAKNIVTAKQIQDRLGDVAKDGILQRYRSKLLLIKAAVDSAKKTLHHYRNLDEDYCRISSVKIENVAVCADVEVAPDADIEKVQAQIWYEISQYLNPPVHFYSLAELTGKNTLKEPAEGTGESSGKNNSPLPVEELFNGPALEHGFIKPDELKASNLKTVLRTSDIINRLMDIEGVRAVNNLLLSKYDELGNVVKGAADPTFSNTNPPTPIFDSTKSSAAWLLYLAPLHQPRLYFNLSRFLFYKNGLPFLPRMDEALDTYKLISGEAERPKIKNATSDLPIPIGAFRNPEAYSPVQYSFPKTYGIGLEGLPSHVPPERRVQAKQLKAYLMVFEQILGNAHAQLAHVGDLFSLNPATRKTYFTRLFDNSTIDGYSDVVNSLNADRLQEMVETEEQFEERRNRFLDHLLARFGEQFTEYALLLTNFQGEQVGRKRLIEDKLSFLKAYPSISHDRGKAFDYYSDPFAEGNTAGLKRRIALLLGYPALSFSYTVTDAGAGSFLVTYQLKDSFGLEAFAGQLTVTAFDKDTARTTAHRLLLRQMIGEENYEPPKPEGDEFMLVLKDDNGNEIGQTKKPTAGDATALKTELLNWSSNERSIVVEHLLLRPKFPGDALFDLCESDDCACEDDPYSFRLTVVMPGWTEPFDVNMEMRQFANNTIQQETPSHLLVKTCWLGNEGFLRNPCDLVVTSLADLLEEKGRNAANERPTPDEACKCALALYDAFSDAFENWYKNKAKDFLQPDALLNELKTLFDAAIDPSTLSCTTVMEATLWSEVKKQLQTYFHQIALYGYQFERFEDAWYAWLDANRRFDWTEERLQERIESMLLNNVQGSLTPEKKSALCNCASNILLAYGSFFYQWMDENLKQGHAFDNLTPFAPTPPVLCTGLTFKPGTQTVLDELLLRHYSRYKEVSYRLRVVVHLLQKLRNTYPGATLHDCDDGSDQNPVRLNSTALGNYPLRRSDVVVSVDPIAPSPAPEVPGPGPAGEPDSDKPDKTPE